MSQDERSLMVCRVFSSRKSSLTSLNRWFEKSLTVHRPVLRIPPSLQSLIKPRKTDQWQIEAEALSYPRRSVFKERRSILLCSRRASRC